MKKKLFAIGMVILVGTLMAGNAISIEYNTNISPELTVEVGDCFYMDIRLDDVPEPLVTAGFAIVHDASLTTIIDVAVYDEYPDGPWDGTCTYKVPDAGGPGTYMLACCNLAGVSPDDVKIAEVEICPIAEGVNIITISTIPGFDTVVSSLWVFPNSVVYDPQIVPHTITVDQIIPPCRCEITGQDIVQADPLNTITAQYSVSSNLLRCDNPPDYVWSDTCTTGDVDQTGLLYVPATLDYEECTICVMDTANTDIVTGEPTECCKEIFIEGDL